MKTLFLVCLASVAFAQEKHIDLRPAPHDDAIEDPNNGTRWLYKKPDAINGFSARKTESGMISLCSENGYSYEKGQKGYEDCVLRNRHRIPNVGLQYHSGSTGFEIGRMSPFPNIGARP